MLAETLTVLRAAYPRAQFPPETVTVYMESLADLPDEEVAAACRRLILRAMYLPTIAEIRRDVIERRNGWPTPGEAWQLVQTGAAHGHPCEPLAEAYKAMGGKWGVKTATNLGALRHGFERDYDQRVEQAVLADMTAKGGRGRVLPPAGERSAVASRNGPEVPSTPVERRMARRFLGEALDPPTDAEKSDAIRVLGGGHMQPEPKGDAIYAEAERIFAEGAA